MARITDASLTTFLAFGNASIAASEVDELARRGLPGDTANELLAELRTAHVRLRDLFADGLDDAVCALARDVMELASKTTAALEQDQGPSGLAVDLGRLHLSCGCAAHAGGTACGARRRIAPTSGWARLPSQARRPEGV